MLTEVGCKFSTCGLRHRNQVFDAHSVFDLTTDAFCYDGHIQALARRIDCCSTTGRTTTDYEHIVVATDSFEISSLCAKFFFEFVQKTSHFATTAMHQFAFVHHSRYALQVEGVGFSLEECTIDNLVCEVVVEQSHDIEGLHYIWAVSARERNVGGEVNRTFEGFDATSNSFVGERFSFAVCVVHREEERGKLVSTRDAAENDASVLSIFGKHHAEGAGSFYHFKGEVIGGRSEIGEKLLKLVVALVRRISFETKSILRFQCGKHLFNLLEKALFDHNIWCVR